MSLTTDSGQSSIRFKRSLKLIRRMTRKRKHLYIRKAVVFLKYFSFDRRSNLVNTHTLINVEKNRFRDGAKVGKGICIPKQLQTEPFWFYLALEISSSLDETKTFK